MPDGDVRDDDVAIDRSTLTALYETYGPIVHRRALTLLGDPEEARDAMQEVFLRVMEKHDGYRGDAPVLHWVYRITTNLCLNRIRQRRAHPVVEDMQAVLTLVEGGTPDVVDRHTVIALLARADELTQEIAVHYFVDEMSLEEVAQVVGRSRKTVAKKLERFRARARAILEARPIGATS